MAGIATVFGPLKELFFRNGDGQHVRAVTLVGSDGVEASLGGGAASADMSVGQNALSTVAEEVLAANADRVFAEVKNLDSGIAIYIGTDNTVTSGNGHLLGPGEAFAFDGYSGAVWAIAASGTPSVSTIEW